MMETGSVVKETPSTYPSQLCGVVPPPVSWWILALLSRKHRALTPASCVALFHHWSHDGNWLCCQGNTEHLPQPVVWFCSTTGLMVDTGSVVKETPSTYPSQLCGVVPPLVSWWKLALLSRKHRALTPASCVALFHHWSHDGNWLCCQGNTEHLPQPVVWPCSTTGLMMETGSVVKETQST